MASPTAASPLPASPSHHHSPTVMSPNMSGRSSPRTSPHSTQNAKASPPSADTCAMILSWLRTAVPAILQAAGHRTRRPKGEDPVQTIAATLNDGVVLAELVSFLDPIRLPPSAISRGVARNALSLPSSQSPPTSSGGGNNIDARQMYLQYKNNTRRVIGAVKKVLEDVRSYSGFPHHPMPGAVDTFLGNVPGQQPTQDLRPSIRLAELVIATAVYGPRHNEFRHSIWRFPTEATQSAFHVAMTAVGQSVALPPPDVLYAAGPPPPRSVPSFGIISSPHASPRPSHILSPPIHAHGPRPPLSPVHVHSPSMMSPRAAFIPNPIIAPQVPMPLGVPTPPHAPHTPPLYAQRSAASPKYGSPRQKMPPSYPPAGGPPRPTSSGSPDARVVRSSRRSSSESPRGSSRSSRRQVSRSPRVSTSTSKAQASPQGRSSIPKQPTCSDDVLTPLTRSTAPDAQAAPLTEECTASHSATVDDGMGCRKFSMVTDEESRSTSPPEVSASNLPNPTDNEPRRDASGDLRAVASEATHVVESDIVQSMRVLEREHQTQVEGSSRYEDASIENEPGSKRSSDEFYTPKEESPSSSLGASKIVGEPEVGKRTTALSPPSEEVIPDESAHVPPTPSEDYLPSPPITSTYMDTRTNQYYKDTKVDETVRQSVATSITEHISRATTFNNPGSSTTRAPRQPKVSYPRVPRGESNTNSIDVRDASYVLSPSASDAPSPSNQWQISQQKGVGQDILSPMPLYSPPPMPARMTRTATATQVTPPPGQTIHSVAHATSLGASSTGGQSTSTLDSRTHEDRRQDLRTRSDQSPHHLEAWARERSKSVSASIPEGHSLPPHPSAASKYSQPSPQVALQKDMQPFESHSDTHMQPGKSRVSFAPTITSPGGRVRPLGEPLRVSEDGDGDRPTSLGTSGSTASFSLPPSAAGEDDDDQEESEEDVHSTELGSREIPYHTDSQNHESSTEDRYGVEDGDAEAVGTGGKAIFAATGHESYLEREAFEKVEEYVVFNSDDERKQGDGHGLVDIASVGDSDERDVDELDGEDPADDAAFEEDEEYVEDTSMALNESEEPGIEPAAEEEIPEQGVGPMTTGNVLATEGGVVESGSGMVSSDVTDSRSGLPRMEGPSVYVPGPMDYITPPAGVRYSRQLRAGANTAQVPETPPSPPNIVTLMESISQSKLTGVDDEEDEDDGPISTMEPSAGLFQKLIAVWQSADEHGQRPESLIAAAAEGQDRVASRLLVPEMSPSVSSGQEPALKSGDAAGEPEKVVPVRGQTLSRSNRPRAMRLPSSSVTAAAIGGDLGAKDMRNDTEEGTSMASFSDAFSSEDKDQQWPENGRVNLGGVEWEEAMKGDICAGLPSSPNIVADGGSHTDVNVENKGHGDGLTGDRVRSTVSSTTRTRKMKSHSVASGSNGVATDGHYVKIDRRRLDWLTRELLAARDAISRKDLQMTFAETQRLEQEEVLLLKQQDAKSIVDAMKKILTEREHELIDARNRLSVAIQSGPSGAEAAPSGTVADRASVESHSSNAGGGLQKLIIEGNAKLHQRLDESEEKHSEATHALGTEMQGLWSEVQRGMVEKMTEMTEKRDQELEALRRELKNRERLVVDLQQSSSDLVDQNRAMQAEASELRLQKEKSAHRYELEMSHVTAQVELVNEFSKKLHDNFRETENLRQQVLQYQDKLSHITSTSGVSQRQIKELREAVTRANDECARLRREADMAEKKGMEAVRRAEELEELRYKDVAAAQSGGRYPDRQDSGSFRSHEPVRPAGHNRPGGSGVNTRYHAQTRARGMPGSSTPAQRAWLQIKHKISGIVTGKEAGASRRRGHGHHRDGSRTGSGSQSQSSQSQSRSRLSRDDDGLGRSSRSGSRSSNASGSVGGSSVRSGPQRSNRSGTPRSPLSGPMSGGVSGTGGGGGSSGDAVTGSAGAVGTGDHSAAYAEQGATHGRGEVNRIRATDF